jgi:hypothetical protein
MPDDAKATYPTIPIKHWWALRDKFKRSLPPAVTTDYLSAALGINEKSAPDIFPSLRQMGLVTAEGKTTDRAERWRHDDTYPAVCKEIVTEVYPEELRHAVPVPADNREAAKRWFARKTKTGEIASGKMTAVYQLLVEANPENAPEPGKPSTATQQPPRQASKKAAPSSGRAPVTQAAVPAPDPQPKPHTQGGPSLHIDIQVHIPPDATAEQIDLIFASMAKHLYRSP